jgi:hypothetical protein
MSTILPFIRSTEAYFRRVLMMEAGFASFGLARAPGADEVAASVNIGGERGSRLLLSVPRDTARRYWAAVTGCDEAPGERDLEGAACELAEMIACGAARGGEAPRGAPVVVRGDGDEPEGVAAVRCWTELGGFTLRAWRVEGAGTRGAEVSEGVTP